MKESYGKGVAIHPGPESCVVGREVASLTAESGLNVELRTDRGSFLRLHPSIHPTV
jgi:hypothetical protein